MNNSTKKWDPGKEIVIDGNETKTIKGSNGTQNILELPNPATKITLYSYCNKKQAEIGEKNAIGKRLMVRVMTEQMKL